MEQGRDGGRQRPSPAAEQQQRGENETEDGTKGNRATVEANDG